MNKIEDFICISTDNGNLGWVNSDSQAISVIESKYPCISANQKEAIGFIIRTIYKCLAKPEMQRDKMTLVVGLNYQGVRALNGDIIRNENVLGTMTEELLHGQCSRLATLYMPDGKDVNFDRYKDSDKHPDFIPDCFI